MGGQCSRHADLLTRNSSLMLLRRRTYDFTKRAVDLCLGAVGLIATAPVQAGIAVAVLLTLGRPILFRQRRPGRDGEIFELLKFRTMRHPETEHDTDEQRLTSIGKLLRASSLDELPSLWNVLRGDMSLVGPRPLLVEYLDLYTQEQARRHEVRPGITGLAQVRGRNELDWHDKFDLDVDYVDRRCLLLDLTILLQTVHTVAMRRGISRSGYATVPVFSGREGDDDGER